MQFIEKLLSIVLVNYLQLEITNVEFLTDKTEEVKHDIEEAKNVEVNDKTKAECGIIIKATEKYLAEVDSIGKGDNQASEPVFELIKLALAFMRHQNDTYNCLQDQTSSKNLSKALSDYS